MQRYGYSEEVCLNHSIAWLNYTVEFESHQELLQIQLREKLHLRRAMLAGVMFHNPEGGMEMYEQMMAALGEDDVSDDGWLTNPDAQTDMTSLAAIEQLVKKRIEARNNEQSDRSNGAVS